MILCYLLESSVKTFAKIKWNRLKEGGGWVTIPGDV